MKANSDPKIEYINRMKNLWEEIHPELIFFSAKNLRDQASRVEKNRIDMEIEYILDKNESNNNVANNDSTEDNSNVKSRHIARNNASIISDNVIQTIKNPALETIILINETIKKIYSYKM